MDTTSYAWQGAGNTPLRALAAEAATAELSWREDPYSRWLGGHTSAIDVIGAQRRDAKAVRVDNCGNVVMARYNAKPFDSAKVDRITLAQVNAVTSGFRVDLDAGVVEIAATIPIDALYDVPTIELNALMPNHIPGDNAWRNVLFATRELTPWRITP